MPSRARSSLPAFNRLEMRRTMKSQKLVTLTLRPPMDISPDQLQPTISGHCPGGGCPAATCNLRSVRADRKIEAATGRLALAIGQAARQKRQLSRKRTGSAGQPSRKLGHSNREQSRKRTSLRFTGISQAFPRCGSAVDCGQKSGKDANEVRETSQPPSYVG
jgi:hypothetical protein